MIDVSKTMEGLGELKRENDEWQFYWESQVCADALDLIKKLWRDVNHISSCSNCKWRDYEYCNPDADDNSDALKRWQECMRGNKIQWEWDSEWQ